MRLSYYVDMSRHMDVNKAQVAFAALALPAFSQDPNPGPPPQMRALVDNLKLQSGEVTLKGGLAKIALPEDFRFLGPDEANTVLTKVWGNPPGAHPLGMIVPARADLLSDTAWAVIVTWDEDGYVKDDDAAKINYTDLLKQIKEGIHAANAERARRRLRRSKRRSPSTCSVLGLQRLP